MEKFPPDANNCIESELADIGMVPLAAAHRWRDPAMRAAMASVVRRAGNYQVYDQSSCMDDL